MAIWHPQPRPQQPRNNFAPLVPPAGPVLLEDNFDDNSTDVTKWIFGSVAFENAAVGVAEANQQLEISPLALTGTPAIYGYKSVNTYDFTAREASIRVAADIDPNTEAWLVVALDADNYLRTWVAGGNLQTRSRVAASNTNQSHGTFSFATHTYWRIRHDNDSDEIVWEYSADGLEWVELRRITRPITVTSVSVYLSGGTGSSVASPGLVKFDDFNLRTPAAFETISRTASLAAAVSIETAAQFFSVLERSTQLTAVSDISIDGQSFSVIERSASCNGLADLQASSQFFSLLERSFAVDAVVATSVVAEHLTTVQRSVSLDALAAVTATAEFFTTLDRSLAIDAEGAISASAISFTLIETSSSLTATGGIQASGIRVVDRLVSINTTAGIETGAQFFSTLESSVVVAASAVITVSGQRSFDRSAAVDGSAEISVFSESFSVLERMSGFDSAVAITINHQRELMRPVALEAVVDILVRGEGAAEEFERSSSLDATASISVSGHVIVERAVSCGLAGSISVAGTFFSTLESATQFNGDGSIEISALTIHERAITLSVTAGISADANFYSLLESAAAVDGTATISVSGLGSSIDGLERSIALNAIGTIGASGFIAAIILHPTNVNLLNSGELSAVVTNGMNSVSINSGETEARLNG